MVTKEQCILDRVLSEIGYGRNYRLAQYFTAAYNQGKKYISEMIFQNDERGLDQALKDFSPSHIIYSILGEDSEYNIRDPFFVVDSGIRSIDTYDIERMLKPEDTARILNQAVLDEIDESTYFDAFVQFIEENYPEFYKVFDYDMMERWSSYDYARTNWDEEVKKMQSQAVNEDRTLELTEGELKKMVLEGTAEALKKIKEGKSGIHIDPDNKGKFNATKERTGKSTEELTHSKNPLTRKRANFARMAKRGWEPLKKS